MRGSICCVEAFARIAARRSEIVLLLAGGGEVADELREQIKRLGIEDRVVMPGRIDHEGVSQVCMLSWTFWPIRVGPCA